MNVVLRIEQVRVIEFCSFLYIFILPEQEQIECSQAVQNRTRKHWIFSYQRSLVS